MLDAGHPASALLGLTAAYHGAAERLPDLHPLWARAYDDLGRPLLRERLDVMLEDKSGQQAGPAARELSAVSRSP